jgi:hypothetical protein
MVDLEDLRFFSENWYPCVIVHDRYSGSYSGALWIAFMRDDVPPDSQADDVTCMNFWSSFDEPFGRGSTPQGAVEDLAKLVDQLRSSNAREGEGS